MAQGSSSEVFGRGLDFLDLIAESRHGLSIEQLAEAREMHRSSIYRYIAPLLERLYIEKTPEGRYRLGPKSLELASRVLERMDIRNIAHPLLIRLSEKLNVTVHLGRLEGPEIIYLDKVETRRSLPIVSRIGGRAAAYCTGLGKALLASLPQERLDEILPKIQFERFTPTTVQDVEQLLAELVVTRTRGYALDNEEHEPGIACVATPVFDLFGEPLAAVSATTSARELNRRLDDYIERVQEIAKEISKSMGYRGGSAR